MKPLWIEILSNRNVWKSKSKQNVWKCLNIIVGPEKSVASSAPTVRLSLAPTHHFFLDRRGAASCSNEVLVGRAGGGRGWAGAAVWAVSGSRAAVRDIWGLSGLGGVTRQQVEGRRRLLNACHHSLLSAGVLIFQKLSAMHLCNTYWFIQFPTSNWYDSFPEMASAHIKVELWNYTCDLHLFSFLWYVTHCWSWWQNQLLMSRMFYQESNGEGRLREIGKHCQAGAIANTPLTQSSASYHRWWLKTS